MRTCKRVVVAALSVAFSAAVFPAHADEFSACLSKLRQDAVRTGISSQVFDTALSGVTPDETVLDAMDAQPEFTTPLWDYMAGLVDEQRVADGREKLAQLGSVL